MGDEPESASSTGLTVSTDSGSVSGNNDNTPESGAFLQSLQVILKRLSVFGRFGIIVVKIWKHQLQPRQVTINIYVATFLN